MNKNNNDSDNNNNINNNDSNNNSNSNHLREFACLTTIILAPLRVEAGLHGRSATSVELS